MLSGGSQAVGCHTLPTHLALSVVYLQRVYLRYNITITAEFQTNKLFPLVHTKCLTPELDTLSSSVNIGCNIKPFGRGRGSFYSLTAVEFKRNFRWSIFSLIWAIDGWCISNENTLRQLSVNLTDDKSTLVQVMVWCRQATSLFLSRWCENFMSPYCLIRPQLVTLWCVQSWEKAHPVQCSNLYLTKTDINETLSINHLKTKTYPLISAFIALIPC